MWGECSQTRSERGEKDASRSEGSSGGLCAGHDHGVLDGYWLACPDRLRSIESRSNKPFSGGRFGMFSWRDAELRSRVGVMDHLAEHTPTGDTPK